MPDDREAPQGPERRMVEGEFGEKRSDISMRPLAGPVPGGIPGAPMDSIRPAEVAPGNGSVTQAPTNEAPPPE